MNDATERIDNESVGKLPEEQDEFYGPGLCGAHHDSHSAQVLITFKNGFAYSL
jgi:hypothetical protein